MNQQDDTLHIRLERTKKAELEKISDEQSQKISVTVREAIDEFLASRVRIRADKF